MQAHHYSRWFVLGWILAGVSLIQAQPIINKVIRIQPIQVCSDDGSIRANPNRILFETETRKIWAQAGIQIEFLPWNTFYGTLWLDLGVNLFGDDFTVFNLANIPGHGQNPDPKVINVWFVRSIGGGGYYGHSWQTTVNAEHNGVAVADNAFTAGRLDIIAHEIGHNLGLDHDTLGAGAATNLMSVSRQVASSLVNVFPDGDALDFLNPIQINQARSTSFATEPVILKQPASQTVTGGSTVTFTCLANGTTQLYFRWWFGQTNLLGWSTNNTLTLTNVQAGQAGSYHVVITNLSGVITSSIATLIVILDSDGDGMPDVWELAQGFQTNSAADALLDSDNDGMNNLSEYLTGTDPHDPLSVMKLENLTPPSAGNNIAFITFLAKTGLSYTVQRSFSLASPTWQTFTNIPPAASNQLVTVQDTSPIPQTQRFYRLLSPAQ